jgi:hypothetical protein
MSARKYRSRHLCITVFYVKKSRVNFLCAETERVNIVFFHNTIILFIDFVKNISISLSKRYLRGNFMHILKIVFLLTVSLFNITYAADNLPIPTAPPLVYEQAPIALPTPSAPPFETNTFGDAVYTFNQTIPSLRYNSTQKNQLEIQIENDPGLKLYRGNQSFDMQIFYISAALQEKNNTTLLTLDVVGDTSKGEWLTPGKPIVINNPKNYEFYDALLQQMNSEQTFHNSANFTDPETLKFYKLSIPLIALWAQKNNLIFKNYDQDVPAPLARQKNKFQITFSDQITIRPTFKLSVKASKPYDNKTVNFYKNGKYFEIINAYRSKLKFPDEYEITLKIDGQQIDDLNATYSWDETSKPNTIEAIVTPPQKWRVIATGDVLRGEKLLLPIINQGNTVKLVKNQIRAQVNGLHPQTKNYTITITRSGKVLGDNDLLPLTGSLENYGIVLNGTTTTQAVGSFAGTIWMRNQLNKITTIDLNDTGLISDLVQQYKHKNNLPPNSSVRLMYAGKLIDESSQYKASDIVPLTVLYAIEDEPKGSSKATQLAAPSNLKSTPTPPPIPQRNLSFWQRWTSGKIWSDWLQQKKNLIYGTIGVTLGSGLALWLLSQKSRTGLPSSVGTSKITPQPKASWFKKLY